MQQAVVFFVRCLRWRLPPVHYQTGLGLEVGHVSATSGSRTTPLHFNALSYYICYDAVLRHGALKRPSQRGWGDKGPPPDVQIVTSGGHMASFVLKWEFSMK